MNEGKNKKKSLLVFIDEDKIKKSIFVEILDVNTFVKFKTDDGNIVSIPANSVVKIKQRGGLV